jgi:tetratricopeptide (TPR) repeat protein
MLVRLFKELGSKRKRTDSIYRAVEENIDQLMQKAYQLYQIGDREAELTLKRILDRDPSNVDTLCLLAEIHLARNDDDGAARFYVEALKNKTDIPSGYIALAQICMRRGQISEAEKCLIKLESLPELAADILNNCGILWLGMNMHARAEMAFRRALIADSNYAAAWCNLGIVLQHAGAYIQAQECFEKSILLAPEFPEALHNYGLLLRDLGQPEAAVDMLIRALELKPDYGLAHANLGVAYQDLGYVEEALLAFDRALALEPTCADIRVTKAQLLLSLGRFREGWIENEHRLSVRGSPRGRFPFPQWDGCDLKGGRLLVYSEQGLGDEIMFASCLPDLLRTVDQCVIECDPRLESTFRRSFPQAMVVGNRFKKVTSWLRELPPIDWQVAIGSLPQFFRNDSSEFPVHSGYLLPDPRRVECVNDRLERIGRGLKIGLSWRGGTTKTNEYLRSIPLLEWKQILRQTGVHFVNLQYTDCSEEVSNVSNSLGVKIHQWKEALEDYEETIALVSSLDVVITVCTALAHLAGALGRPTWVLVPCAPGWRYMREGDQMLWYPSVRLFRQKKPLQWESVINEISSELDEFSRQSMSYLHP